MLPEFKKGSQKRSRGEGDHDSTLSEFRPTKRTSLGSTSPPCPPDAEVSEIPSLKRQRSGDDHCTPLVEQDQPTKRISLGSTDAPSSMSPFSTVTLGILEPQPRCIHKIKTGCSLSSTGCCCACADKRAKSSTYLIYLDGDENVMSGKRWHWYCKGCNKFWRRESARGTVLQEPLSFPGSEAGIEIVIAQHLQTIKILQSTDLTVDALKIEIARALACDPSALVLNASGIDLDTIGLHQQEALRELQKISCFPRLDEACDLMDGIQWS